MFHRTRGQFGSHPKPYCAACVYSSLDDPMDPRCGTAAVPLFVCVANRSRMKADIRRSSETAASSAFHVPVGGGRERGACDVRDSGPTSDGWKTSWFQEMARLSHDNTHNIHDTARPYININNVVEDDLLVVASRTRRPLAVKSRVKVRG